MCNVLLKLTILDKSRDDFTFSMVDTVPVSSLRIDSTEPCERQAFLSGNRTTRAMVPLCLEPVLTLPYIR